MAAEFGDDDVDALTERAFIHNDRVGISGMLFCFSDRFIQVLEGPGAAIGELYERIRLDPRHRDVITVQDGPIEERAYGNWGMRRIRSEDLGETEKALVFHALHVFEPRTLIGPKVRAVGAGSTRLMNRIMTRARPEGLALGDSDEISRLLYAAEIILARDRVLDDALLEEAAKDAHVSAEFARAYFPTIADLMRACVSRVVALEHQAFLSRMISRRFADKAELAGFITDFIIGNHDRTAVSHRFADQFAEHGGDFTRQTAWILATAALEATPRAGWPFADLDTSTLAAAIGATDGAARILARHDFVGLADPATRMRLFRTCLTAIGGRADDEAAVSRQTRTRSLSEATTTLFAES
jgi:hypothetical protein